MKKIRLFLVMVLLVTSAASASMTLTLTDTQNFVSSTATRDFEIVRFDPALGPLNSVHITMTGSSEVRFHYTNSSDAPIAGDIEVRVSGLVELVADGAVLTSTPHDETRIVSLDLDAYETHYEWFGPIVATDAITTLYPGDFDNFVGSTGNCPLSVVKTSLTYSYTGISDHSAGFRTYNSYAAEVSYNYIPEPASLALLGLGGLALIRRRRAA